MVQTGSGMLLWTLWALKSLRAKASHLLPLRINVIIVPVSLPGLEIIRQPITGKAFLLPFPVPLWLFPWTLPPFLFCSLRTSLSSLPPSCSLPSFLPPLYREGGNCFLFLWPQRGYREFSREVSTMQENWVTVSLRTSVSAHTDVSWRPCPVGSLLWEAVPVFGAVKFSSNSS